MHLRDRGILTDGEFAEQKARTLGQQSSATPFSNSSNQSAPLIASTGQGRPRSEFHTSSIGEPPKKGKVGKILGFGCLGILGLLFILGLIGSQLDPQNSTAPSTAKQWALYLAGLDFRVFRLRANTKGGAGNYIDHDWKFSILLTN